MSPWIDEIPPTELSRRRLLQAGAAGLAGAAGAGLILPGTALAADAAEDLPPHGPAGIAEPGAAGGTPRATISRNYLGTDGCRLHYEPSGAASSFSFNSTFYNQLADWKTYTHTHAPDSWGWPWRIYSYGALVNKPGMHGQGRAFDIGKIIYRNSDGVNRTISMRYDQWRNWGNADTYKRRYWGSAASLMRWFRHVLTYADNSDHHNHIHVDNAIYGSLDGAGYATGSTSQTYIVQGVCRYVWGHTTALDGLWGDETRSHSTSVLRRIGRESGTITNRNNFWSFCSASFRKAVGKQSY